MDLSEIKIRTTFLPGDIGYLVHMHGSIYSREYNHGCEFEGYVADGLNEFVRSFDDHRDRLWIAEHEDRIVGSILIVGRSGRVAQLRYFLVDPGYRGIGLGKRLMDTAMTFCRETGYSAVYLWTTNELNTAAHLYKSHGFERTLQVKSTHFGKSVTEDCYDVSL